MIRVGVVGGGQAGERHLDGFSQLPNVEVVGIVDTSIQRRVELSNQYKVTAYEDYRSMIDAGIDILVVCVPHHKLCSVAMEAAKAGIHVLVEKPMATNVDDAQLLVSTCKQSGVKLGVCFVHRYRMEAKKALEWMTEGSIGNVSVASETMITAQRQPLPEWLMIPEMSGGGVMMYSAIHAVDRLCWLLEDEVVRVTGRCGGINNDVLVEKNCACLLEFSRGTTGILLSASHNTGTKGLCWETNLHGSEGIITVRAREWARLSSLEHTKDWHSENHTSELGPHYNFQMQAEDFVEAVMNDREPRVTGQDGLHALSIVKAIYLSNSKGVTQTVPTIAD